MNYRIMLLFFCIVTLFAGCASTGKNAQVSQFTPWHEHLNPASDEVMSDWALLDMDADTYRNMHKTRDNLLFDLKGTFWE